MQHSRQDLHTQNIKTGTETITELETLQQLQVDKQLHTPVLCALHKYEFEEFRKNKPQEWVIIQLINSRRTEDKTIVAFYVSPRDLILTTADATEPTHLYWDEKKFWDIDLEHWNLQGKIEIQEQQYIQKRNIIQRQVKIHPEAHQHKLFIS